MAFHWAHNTRPEKSTLSAYPMWLYHSIRMAYKSMFQHRFAAISWFVIQGLSIFFEYVAIWVVIGSFGTIQGWTAEEVMVLYALNLMSYGLAGFYFYNPVTSMDQLVIDGRLDMYLTKPLNPLFNMASRMFNTGYVTHFGVSLVVTLASLSSVSIEWSPLRVLHFLTILAGGALIQCSLLLLTGSAAFWLTRHQSLYYLIMGPFRDFIAYPISIYPQAIRFVLTFIIPWGFVNFYPAQYFLGKESTLFHPILQLLAPAVGVVLFAIAYTVWKRGLNVYKGTGS